MFTFLRRITGSSKAHENEQARFNRTLENLDCKEAELDDLRHAIRGIQSELTKKREVIRSLSPPFMKAVKPDEPATKERISEPGYRKPSSSQA